MVNISEESCDRRYNNNNRHIDGELSLDLYYKQDEPGTTTYEVVTMFNGSRVVLYTVIDCGTSWIELNSNPSVIPVNEYTRLLTDYVNKGDTKPLHMWVQHKLHELV